MSFLDQEEDLSGNIVKDHWRGLYSLPRSYWVNGALISTVAVGMTLVIVERVVVDSSASLQTAAAVGLATGVTSIAVWVWSIVGIWRSADRHTDRGGSSTWAGVAKVMVVLGALATVGQLSSTMRAYAELGQLAAGSDPLGDTAAVSVEGARMLISGTISQGTASKVAAALASSGGVREIHLSSDGGRIREAQQIADLARKRGLDTVAVGPCESACTFILMAGQNRSAMRGASVGFHQPSFAELQGEELRAMIADMERDYRQAGLRESFIAKAMDYSAEEMWYPTEAELFEAGVLNGFSQGRVLEENRTSERAVNAQAPARLDEVTILEGASANGMELNYRYRIEADPKDLDVSLIETDVAESVRQEVCKEPLMSELFASGAVYNYRYIDRSGRQFAKFSLKSC